MAQYSIPLTNGPQRFRIQLLNTVYQFVLIWRDTPGGGWFLDINKADGTPIVAGIAFVTGADLLAPYKHLNIGGSLYVYTPGDIYQDPGYNDLGTKTSLIFITEE